MPIAFGHKLGENMSYGGGSLDGWTTRSFSVAAPGADVGDFIWTPADGHRANVSNTLAPNDPSDPDKPPPYGIYDSEGQQYSVNHPDRINPEFDDPELQGGILLDALETGDTIEAYYEVTQIGNTRKTVHGYRFTGLGNNPEVIGMVWGNSITIPDNDEWLVLYWRFDQDGSNTCPPEDLAWNTLTRSNGSSSITSHEYLAYKIVSSAGAVSVPNGTSSGYLWALKYREDSGYKTGWGIVMN